MIMDKIITLSVAEKEVKALSSVLVDVLSYYGKSENSPENLEKLREASELSLKITESFYEQKNDNSNSKPNEGFKKLSINKLSLSASILNRLKEQEVYTVGDLLKFTPEGLSKIRYMKSKSIDNIVEVLAGMGLKLRNDNNSNTNISL